MDTPTARIALQLTRYLGRNGWACDTQEGIARWWLGGMVDAAALAEALEWLTRHGFVQATAAIDGHLRYRLTTGADAAELQRQLENRLAECERLLH